MKIYKFGGASVKDAAGVRNLVRVISTTSTHPLGVVVSAMGKTTNALENIIALYQKNDSQYLSLIDQLLQEHLAIATDLERDQLDLGGSDGGGSRFRESGIKKELQSTVQSLKGELLRNKSRNYSFLYDQVVSHGELMSTKIVAAYLNANGLKTQWLDARELIRTDSKYRGATVDWEMTCSQINKIDLGTTFVTQGFIGSDPNGLTTTLGREGSDYTAGILAYCLDSSSVTIWKDVKGVLNADPREFKKTTLLKKIPYNEAIELAFYGASVIHPKTLQPLQKKKIPLNVKSFVDPQLQGSCIDTVDELEPYVPCYIVRKNMIFIRVSAKDFSFIGEDNISDIFKQLSLNKMQVGLLQNSAISFSLCIEDKYGLRAELITALKERYEVSYTDGVSLYTIRHYSSDQVDFIENDREVLLRQRTQKTLQLVVKQ